MTLSGRRPNDRANRVGRSILHGLAALGTAMSDAPKYARIEEIDKTILDLKQERDHLIANLIEPGELKVSEDYDPRWRKPEATPKSESMFDEYFGAPGRLVECKGRSTSSRFHDAHPACPYIDTIHNAHEFTARD